MSAHIPRDGVIVFGARELLEALSRVQTAIDDGLDELTAAGNPVARELVRIRLASLVQLRRQIRRRLQAIA